MKLILGIGNYGKQYEHTRHNMGFDVLDKFAESLGTDIDREDFKGLYTKTKYFDEDLILLKPLTYVNLSGDSLILAMNFYKISPEDIIVVYDDMDIEPGKIKLKENGSSAGHNGIKSIINVLGSEKFKRIRIGTGKAKYNIVDYVLSKPTDDEQKLINIAQDNAVAALKIAIKESFEKAMNLYNNK